jgi:hypothetical protein
MTDLTAKAWAEAQARSEAMFAGWFESCALLCSLGS